MMGYCHNGLLSDWLMVEYTNWLLGYSRVIVSYSRL